MSDATPRTTDRPMLAIGTRLVAVFLFGIMFVCIKLLGAHNVGMIESMFYRNLIALLLMIGWIANTTGLAGLRTRHIRKHLVRAAVGLTGMVFTFASYRLLPLAEATTIGFTTPIFATILAVLFLHEFVGIHRWSAVIIGFIGVLLVTRPGSGDIPLHGAVVALMSALIIAIVSIQIRDMSRTEAAGTIVFYFSLFGTLVLMPIMPFVAVRHDVATWGIIALLGLTGGIAQLVGSLSLRYGPVSLVVSMDYTQLIWSTVFGFALFNVLPTPSTWTGAPLIIASGLYIAYREHKRRRVARVISS